MKTVELASKILTQLGFYQEPSRELGVDDRRDNIVHLIEEYTTPQTNDGCGNCHACLVGVKENGFPITSQRMILCSDCGNKRCPKASNHRHQCTGSNEPNQRGSIYTTPQTKQEHCCPDCGCHFVGEFPFNYALQTKPLSDEEIEEVIRKHWNREYGNRNMLTLCKAVLEEANK